MGRSLSRQRMTLYVWLTIAILPPLLLNFNSLLKLTQDSSTEDHDGIDMDHPSFIDRVLLKCTTFDRETKTTSVTNVTPDDFYAEGSKCGHSFKEDTVAFHVGKGGGGTLMKHLGIGVNWVHPLPKSSINEQLQSGPLRTLIFNVRDPVDRFISAFNWRSIILCHPNDERHRGKKKIGKGKRTVGGTKRPDEFCKDHYEEEEIMLRETYESNPNVLAEALCHDSPLRPRAEQDFGNIHHSTTLTQWLDFLIDPRLAKNITNDGIQKFLVLPVEKRSGANETLFEKHIENLQRHLLKNRYGVDASDKMMQLAQEKKVKKEEEERRLNKPKRETHLHSSSNFHNSTKPMLTKLGECCLARYLIDDYRLIQSMLGGGKASNIDLAIAGLDPLDAHPVIQKACTWGNEQHKQECRGDLISMLMKRAKYLDESKGSCSAIVSAE